MHVEKIISELRFNVCCYISEKNHQIYIFRQVFLETVNLKSIPQVKTVKIKHCRVKIERACCVQ